MESPPRSGRPKQRHWLEQKVHDFSGRGRARRRSRGNRWRFRPARCRRFNLDNARGDPKEDFRLAHWLLGEIRDKWVELRDRKSTRLNSSHRCISYAVFCLKKKK